MRCPWDYPLDVLVFATGYDGITGPLLRLNITGRGGRRLADEWQGGPRTYLGLQVPGFPNMFTVTGMASRSRWMISGDSSAPHRNQQVV